MARPSAGYAITLTVELSDVPGTFGRLAVAIGEAGGDIEAVDLIGHDGEFVIREITVKCGDVIHGEQVAAAVQQVPGITVRDVADRTFVLHRGGKLEIMSRIPLRSRDDLSMAYTPGVGRVSAAIAAQPERVWELTGKGNAVAVLSNGTAVLGLGNIGPEAAMPVMEGKAVLFKEFAGIDAYPLCVRAETADEVVAVARAIAPGFGGINLEDIAAPDCFEIEERLRVDLDIPVFHDDQHGTAVVTLAAMLNAARVTGRSIGEMRAVFLGVGAAGVACAKLLLAAGVGDVVAVDRNGILGPDEVARLSGQKRWIAEHTNRSGLKGDLEQALVGADAFIGLSGPDLVKPEWVAAMAPQAIVFAMANPIPEIMPDDVPANVAVVATGRSDYPNQINNVLVFPGFFRGLLDARARTVDDRMKLAAARALADLISPEELSSEYIVPSVFDRRVAPAIGAAVRDAV
ncbi:MAG TPA: NAD-dependent malic enzyme [Acidimicrobiia bacterium]|jgi:malate dehydrogenase (oxaloacetate-decarboxylating)